MRKDDSGASTRVGLRLGALDALSELALRLKIPTERPARHRTKFKLKVSEHDDFVET